MESKIDLGEQAAKPSRMRAAIEDVPPWGMTLVYALQHYITMFGATVTYPYLLSSRLCLRDDDPARGSIIATILFISGVTTVLQSTFGTRLPIVQGSCYAFLAPTLTLLSLPQWRCPDANSTFYDSFGNEVSGLNRTEDQWTELWQYRIREVSGGILVGSVAEILLGLTGAVGFLMRWIGPITAAPVIMLIGLSVVTEIADSVATNMPIAVLTIVLMVIFTQHMENIPLPLPYYTKAEGFRKSKFYLFKTFPVLVCVALTWSLCAILTACGVLSEGSAIRTDSNMDIIHQSPWIRVPYPGQWGLPTISGAGVVLGFLAGALSSMLESFSDYFSCARISSAPCPPAHALNRGILFEGVGGVIAAFLGCGTALTSYSCNIATISITKVASRRVVQVCGVLTLVLGVVGKVGAVFAVIPLPVAGGLLAFMFLVIVGVGLELVQYLDLNTPRNGFIIGCSLFWGLCLPAYIKQYPNAINTGVQAIDQTLIVLCSTSLFVGGVIALVLDNTVAATRSQRGIDAWLTAAHEEKFESDPTSTGKEMSAYDFPYGMAFLERHQEKLRFFPFLPVTKTKGTS